MGILQNVHVCRAKWSSRSMRVVTGDTHLTEKHLAGAVLAELTLGGMPSTAFAGEAGKHLSSTTKC